MNAIVISGGPGSGKTTLLNALKNRGFNGSDEVSRQLIQEQVILETENLPWKNLSSFAELALERMIDQYKKSLSVKGFTFFDRAIPDIVAYLKVGKLEVKSQYHNAIKSYPYHPNIFIAPPWEAIYVNDDERWQTFEEATEIYQMLAETYQSAGYTIIELPFSSVENRVDFILGALAQDKYLQTPSQNYSNKSKTRRKS
ncbi:MAG: AAA family ATPase [Dyadobacter sp.]